MLWSRCGRSPRPSAASGHEDVNTRTRRCRSSTSASARAASTASSETGLVYDPPRTEKPYKKSVISGTIDTVEYDGNDPTAMTNGDDTCDGDHYQPDGTTVSYSNPDDEEETTTRFCGNVMDYFTPGKHLKMVISDSNVTDYNGCYMLPDLLNVPLTFGGKALPKSAVPKHHVEWKMPTD